MDPHFMALEFSRMVNQKIDEVVWIRPGHHFSPQTFLILRLWWGSFWRLPCLGDFIRSPSIFSGKWLFNSAIFRLFWIKQWSNKSTRQRCPQVDSQYVRCSQSGHSSQAILYLGFRSSETFVHQWSNRLICRCFLVVYVLLSCILSMVSRPVFNPCSRIRYLIYVVMCSRLVWWFIVFGTARK
jgi:hypothetical protein